MLETNPTAERAPLRNGKPSRQGWRRGARWFAAEFLVVVSGVLVALALNAWWAQQQDRQREEAYLRQLRSDLDATMQMIAVADSLMQEPDRAGGQLLRAYQLPEPPPRDSLFTWVRAAGRYRYPTPVTGAARALIATGDLTLIRDPTLRAAIVSYLNEAENIVGDFRMDIENWGRARDDLSRVVDYQEVLAALLPAAEIESLAARYPDFPVPPGPRRGRFPVEVEALLADRAAYDALVQMSGAKMNMRLDRRALREATQHLRARVEAALSD